MKLTIDNWRWAGVPFYLRTGKAPRPTSTEIVIQFRRTPFILFRQHRRENLEANRLVINISPTRASLQLWRQDSRLGHEARPCHMEFDCADYFGIEHNTGYERLLLDCMIGDPTLFKRADTVDAGWRVVDPILDVARASAAGFPELRRRLLGSARRR